MPESVASFNRKKSCIALSAGMILQLTLFYLTKTHEKLQILSTLTMQLQYSNKKELTKAKVTSFVKQAVDQLEDVTGQNFSRSHPSFALHEGYLSKVENYSQNMLLSGKFDNLVIEKIFKQLDKTCSAFHQLGVLCVEIYQEEIKHKLSKSLFDRVDSKLQEITSHFKKLSKSVIDLIPQIPADPSLNLFLLNNHLALNQITTKPMIAKTIQALFPKGGVDQVECDLLKYYSVQGFDHILPLISQRAHELKASKHLV